MLLPTSSIYDFLEGRIPRPADTYTRIAFILEGDEKERINKEIGERRTRLGAKVAQVTEEVRREVLGRSTLEDVYQGIIDWSNDDEVRRQYEEKLLRHAYDTLIVLPLGEEPEKRARVEELARGMVIIKHPYLLAWDITLEWADKESIADHDVGILREYVDYFPDDGLSKVLRGYLDSELSPFPPNPDAETQEDGHGEPDGSNGKMEHLPLSGADRLVVMTVNYVRCTLGEIVLTRIRTDSRQSRNRPWPAGCWGSTIYTLKSTKARSRPAEPRRSGSPRIR